jgi:hypothetical protein
MSKLKPEHRALANPIELRKFPDDKGVLADREQVAEHSKYDWYARKLTFESHFRLSHGRCTRHGIIHAAEQCDDKIFCGHEALLSVVYYNQIRLLHDFCQLAPKVK